MHVFIILVTVVTGLFASAAIPAIVPIINGGDSVHEARSSSSTASIELLNLTSQTTPWPLAPWAYSIPGHTPQHLKFEEISPEETGLEGQQATLHACDEIVRWLWAHYTADQNVDHTILQKSSFAGEKEGHVVMVFVPLTLVTGGGVIGRELALDSVRALEGLVWRYGGRGLECEVLAGGRVKGRISISIKVAKGEGGVDSL